MPIVVGKSVNFLPTKFTPKAGQIYFQEVNLPTVEKHSSKPSVLRECSKQVLQEHLLL